MFKAIEQDFDSLKFQFEETERKTTRGLLIAYVIIAVLLALLIFSFFKFSSDINTLNNEVKDLKKKVSSSLYDEQKSNPDYHFFS
jgi:cell division protein FtsL